jgi:hypothetical protein
MIEVGRNCIDSYTGAFWENQGTHKRTMHLWHTIQILKQTQEWPGKPNKWAHAMPLWHTLFKTNTGVTRETQQMSTRNASMTHTI